MSSTAKPEARSLRTWMVLQTLGASALIGVLSFCVIFGVTRRFLAKEVSDDLTRMTQDLTSEYAEHHGNTPKFIDCMEDDAEERGSENVCILLLDATNGVLHATQCDAAIRARLLKEVQRDAVDRIFLKRARDGQQDRRTIRIRTCTLPDRNRIVIGYDVTDDALYLVFLATASLLGLILTFVLSGFGAWKLGTHFTHSLADIAAAAKRIENGELAQRVPEPPRTGREIISLIRAFNAMCSANERSMTELKTLSDNIAHDLRTPLTRMRGNAELAATGAIPADELAPSVAEETTLLLDMINTMLDISQAGCRIERTPREQVDLRDTIVRVDELYRPVAEDKSLDVRLDLPDTPVPFLGHRGKLQQLVGNLLDNAIKFTPAHGHVSVRLSSRTDSTTLVVEDDGPGIAEQDIPHVFTRFWRSDESRSLSGNGLGLALVKAIVTSYCGIVVCTRVDPHGARFTVTLPTTSVTGER